MPIFTDPQHADDTPRDETFPFLTVEEATSMRELIRDAYAARGQQVTVHPNHLTLADGTVIGIETLVRDCHIEDRDDWPTSVQSYVDQLIAIEPTALPDFLAMAADDIRSRLYLRIQSEHGHNMVPGLRTIAPGLKEVFALTLDGAVAEVPAAALEDAGGVEELRQIALANLRALPIERRDGDRLDGGHVIHLFYGHSNLTASKVLVLDDVMHDVTGGAMPAGALVSLAFRHCFAVHEITSMRTLLQVLPVMIAAARAAYAEGPGPLSPHVYWWNHGAFSQISLSGSDIPALTVIPPHLTELLCELDAC